MESVNSGCEGLMVKTLTDNATYEPSKRSLNWLKLKKDYLQDLGDSLDLVPIGGFYGKGKRTGNYGAFLLACYDVDSEEFQSICKVSDFCSAIHSCRLEQALVTKLSNNIRNSTAKRSVLQRSLFSISMCFFSCEFISVLPGMEPDVWFNPCQVWEVKSADLSISPVHTAAIGMVDPGKGIALRFPRFVRIREDKKPEEATSAEQVVDFYNSQSIMNL